MRAIMAQRLAHLTPNDRPGYIEAFLEEIGERAFALGTVLASLSSGEDYYLVFLTPTQFRELARLFTAHGMNAEIVRRGCWTQRITAEQSAAIRAWATARSGKITAGEPTVTGVVRSPEEEPFG
ncbi:hypothetical protein [Nocardia aurantia]|uniref:hypothetical protein n=1 Tax=Nocardia aurantia TaxID=2585199 RepID=UPI00129804B7|nr:hypothetical protein [Nocardia aurantia]